MEHRLILGASQYLPFARSRIKALRAAGKDYATERFVFPDGLVSVRIVGEHEYIHLTGGMAHGFVVASNWATTLIYKFDGETWAPDSRHAIPQVDNRPGKEPFGYNQVVRVPADSIPGVVLPLVYVQHSAKLWDYSAHKGPAAAGETWRVPFNLQYPLDGATVFNTGQSHMLHDYSVQDLDGVVLYSMTAPTALLLEAEQVTALPGNSDCTGVNAVLQAYRKALVSGESWQNRYCHEVIQRTAQATYEPQQRNVVDLNTPLQAAHTVTVDETFNTLGLDDAGELVGIEFYAGAASTTSDPANPSVNLLVFYLCERRETDYSDIAVKTESAYRSRYELAAATVAPSGSLIALPEVDSVQFAKLLLEIAYPQTQYWRGGTKSWAYDLGALYGGLRAIGRDYSHKERRDASHLVNGSPAATLKLVWVDVKILEGTVAGSLAGNYYVDSSVDWRSGSDLLWYTYAIPDRAPLITDPGGGDSWLWVNAHTNFQPGWSNEWLAAREGDTTIVTDVPLECTGSYRYTSRHIIDYDHRAQFYAAIRIDVECGGALWRQSPTGVRGLLNKIDDPRYTVSIYFESCWKGDTALQLLASSTCTRPAFEFQALWHSNVFIYPAVGDEIAYFMPPQLGLPQESIEQIARLAHHQGVNTNLAAQDVRDDIPTTSPQVSPKGIEFTPLTRFVQGQIYARTFKLSDFPDALWMLDLLKVNAPENDFYPEDGSEVMYFYMPDLGAAINETDHHIEVRNGVIGNWSDDLPPRDEQAAIPAPTSREIKLYQV